MSAPHRHRDQTPSVRNVIAVCGSKDAAIPLGAAFNLARALAGMNQQVGLADLSLSRSSLAKLPAFSARATINTDERIVPVKGMGIAFVAFSDFLPLPQLSRLKPALLRTMLTQFFSLVNWGPLDYLLIDLPADANLFDYHFLKDLPSCDSVLVSATTPNDSDRLRDAARKLGASGIPILGVIESADLPSDAETGPEIPVIGRVPPSAGLEPDGAAVDKESDEIDAALEQAFLEIAVGLIEKLEHRTRQ